MAQTKVKVKADCNMVCYSIHQDIDTRVKEIAKERGQAMNITYTRLFQYALNHTTELGKESYIGKNAVRKVMPIKKTVDEQIRKLATKKGQYIAMTCHRLLCYSLNHLDEIE